MRQLTLEKTERVWLATINRPEKRNALNKEMAGELDEVIATVAADRDCVGLVITGVEESFMSGTDIGYLRERTVRETEDGVVQSLYNRVESIPCPVVAAVNGWALGGGCELALATDIRIASENAVFGLPEVGLGLMPGAGGTQRLTRLVGHGRAMEIIMTGRRVAAAEAERIGLVSRVVPRDDLLSSAMETMGQIAAKGPVAVRLTKQAVKAYSRANLTQGLDFERMAQTVLFATADKKEGVAAYFERRRPVFKGE